MENELASLRDVLLQGIKLSKQGSYARRSPQSEAVPLLEEARSGLRALVQQFENNAEAWRLLSQAEECLLNYRGAISCLQKTMELSRTRSAKDLKRLALLKSSFDEWKRLPLSPDELRKLGQFLVSSGVEDERKGRTLQFTTKYLQENGFDVQTVLRAFADKGAYTDFQVLYNLVRG